MRRGTRRGGGRMACGAIVLGCAAFGVAGCGGKDFANKPRPPVPVQLTGVITKSKVVVSPNKVGAGPVVIIVSNQSGQPHSLTLDGGSRIVRTGVIQPSSTGRLESTLRPGRYQVRVGSKTAQ